MFFSFRPPSTPGAELPSPCPIPTSLPSVAVARSNVARPQLSQYVMASPQTKLDGIGSGTPTLAASPRMSPAGELAAGMFPQHSEEISGWKFDLFFFLSQYKWGETGNIPCGTIGYQRPPLTTPCCSDIHQAGWEVWSLLLFHNLNGVLCCLDWKTCGGL